MTEGAKGKLVGHFQYDKEEAAAEGLKKGKFMAKKIVELAKKVGADKTLIGIKCDSTNENTGLNKINIQRKFHDPNIYQDGKKELFLMLSMNWDEIYFGSFAHCMWQS